MSRSYRILGCKWAVSLDIPPGLDTTIHQPTRPEPMHGHAPVFSLSFHCPPRGGGTPIRKKQPGYGMIENHTQVCRRKAPPVGPFFSLLSNNWCAQMISSTGVCTWTFRACLAGTLGENPDINITSVASTYSTFPVPVRDEPFDCFIPHSIIAVVKGLIYHHLRARGSCAQP
jgi:hypothetical protein